MALVVVVVVVVVVAAAAVIVAAALVAAVFFPRLFDLSLHRSIFLFPSLHGLVNMINLQWTHGGTKLQAVATARAGVDPY